MSFYNFNLVTLSVTPVSVHNKSYMPRDRSLTKSSNEELTELVDAPFKQRLPGQPFANHPFLLYVAVVARDKGGGGDEINVL